MTAPGAGAGYGPGEDGAAARSVRKDAKLPGKLVVKRFGECAGRPGATESVVEDARVFLEGYHLEPGFKRGASRLSGARSRASLFSRTLPCPRRRRSGIRTKPWSRRRWMPSIARRLFRFGAGAPSSYSLRGSLGGHGSAYQFAARPSPFRLPLVSVWLIPTVGHADKVMVAEAVARGLEACGRQMTRRSAESQRSESASSPQGWAFNTVIDCVVGSLLFGLVVNEPGSNDPMLRASLAGAAPSISGAHFVFASDCFPRAAKDGSLDFRSRVDVRGRNDVCKQLMSEWKALEDEWPRGNWSKCARWVSGCPVRLSVGGVGGNRFFGYDSGARLVGNVEVWARRPPECQFGGGPRGGCAWLPCRLVAPTCQKAVLWRRHAGDFAPPWPSTPRIDYVVASYSQGERCWLWPHA